MPGAKLLNEYVGGLDQVEQRLATASVFRFENALRLLSRASRTRGTRPAAVERKRIAHRRVARSRRRRRRSWRSRSRSMDVVDLAQFEDPDAVKGAVARSLSSIRS